MPEVHRILLWNSFALISSYLLFIWDFDYRVTERPLSLKKQQQQSNNKDTLQFNHFGKCQCHKTLDNNNVHLLSFHYGQMLFKILFYINFLNIYTLIQNIQTYIKYINIHTYKNTHLQNALPLFSCLILPRTLWGKNLVNLYCTDMETEV